MEHVQLFEEYTYPKKDTKDVDKTVEQSDDLLAKIYAKKIDYPQVDKEMKRISANEADFTKEAHDKFEKATAIILKTFKNASVKKDEAPSPKEFQSTVQNLLNDDGDEWNFKHYISELFKKNFDFKSGLVGANDEVRSTVEHEVDILSHNL